MTIVKDEDLPAGMRVRQLIAHEIAKQAVEQVWNIAAIENGKLGTQITGNEALSFMGTILSDFGGRWISLMDKIREQDTEAGVLREDMIRVTLNGMLETIGCSATYSEETPLPDGIKKLRN